MTLFERPVSVLEIDHDSRARIRDDLQHNLFVEAGAGTGKTRVLVDRIIRLLATGTVRDMANLVAITFTEAAAAELRDRVRRALDDAGVDDELPDDERARCAQARARIDAATITTLHGFAHRILAEHPMEARLPPAFEVEDEVQARVRFVERWARFLDELYADPTATDDLVLAHALALKSDGLREVARQLHDRWDRVVGADLPTPALPAIDFSAIVDNVAGAVTAAGDLRHLEGDMLGARVNEWEDVRAAIADALEAHDPVEALRIIATTPRRPGGAGRVAVWGSAKAEVSAALDAAADAVDELVGSLRTALLQRLLPRLVAFTLAGAQERRHEGRLEFHDLLVHARDLLRTNDAVRVALAERIDVILIDEFQDTDPLQLDIACALAADDPAAPPPPWEQAVLRAGKVLLVGDPKQSIYRFRGADISLWDRAKRLFPGGVEQLGQNFRTVSPLLEWVNRVFEVVIAEGEEGVQPRYEALAAFRPDPRDSAVVIVGSYLPELRVAELREREAEDLARLISTMKVEGWGVHDRRVDGEWRPARFDDIAILVPTRTPLRQIERALDRADIPYRIESRSLVWATDAVRELLAALAAIDDPGDEVAVVAALRSPGFACSDVDLVEWKLAGGGWDHRRSRPEGIGADHAVAQAMAALAAYHETRGELAVNELVERIVRERRLVELSFVQRRPRDHWRRLRFVVDQARAFVEAGGASLGDFVAWAQLQGDEQATVIETPAPEPDDDAVRILTIHGSKGLEFPVVVLAGLGSRNTTGGTSVHFDVDRPEVSVGPKTARFATPGHAALAEAAGDAEQHEAKRLLYVAATRARDHLAISLYHSKSTMKSHAASLWQVCQEAAAGWWREASFADQLVLPVREPAAFEPMSVAARDRWLGDHAALVERASRRRVWAASALASAGAESDQDAPNAGDSEDEPSPERPERPLHRGGTALGRAVHAVLQTVDLDDPRDIRALARIHAAAEGIPDAAVEVERRVRGALDAPVVREARARPAAKRWREVYVAAPVGDGDALVEGYIDLLFEDERGGLVIVDYKTDAEIAAERYELQAAAYALALEAAARPVQRAVFVYCRPDGAVERSVDDVAAAVAAARSAVTAWSSPSGSR